MAGRFALLTLSALLVAGCSVITPIDRRVPATHTNNQAGVLTDGYHEVTGIIHIHTQYSDGGGTVEDVARVANQQHLDYVVITDHNTLKALRDGKQGWHGMTLVLVGEEISTQAGHYLALNVRDEVDRNHRPTQAIIDDVNRQGGLGFIAHPYCKKSRWRDWTVTGVTGIEGYNTVHNALDENKLRIALWALAVPSEPLYLSMVARPYDPLAAWDQMIAARGRVVGIGSSDAHEIRVLGVKFAPYEIMFKLVRTHVLLPEGAALAEQPFYDNLRAGHAYFSIGLVGDAAGFMFMADDGARVLGVMGDQVPLSPGLQLTAVLPAAGDMTVFKDGVAAAGKTDTVWRIRVTEPGVYRLEVMRHGKPWIFSNPIYVTPQAAP